MRRAAIERYARYCGPAVLAKLLGIPRVDAAELLQLAGARGPGTNFLALSSALRGRGVRHSLAHTNDRLSTDAALRDRYRHYGAVPMHEYAPTVAGWLREHRDAHVMLATASHWIYVCGGRIVEHNGTPQRRGRVLTIIYIHPDPEDR